MPCISAAAPAAAPRTGINRPAQPVLPPRTPSKRRSGAAPLGRSLGRRGAVRAVLGRCSGANPGAAGAAGAARALLLGRRFQATRLRSDATRRGSDAATSGAPRGPLPTSRSRARAWCTTPPTPATRPRRWTGANPRRRPPERGQPALRAICTVGRHPGVSGRPLDRPSLDLDVCRGAAHRAPCDGRIRSSGSMYSRVQCRYNTNTIWLQGQHNSRWEQLQYLCNPSSALPPPIPVPQNIQTSTMPQQCQLRTSLAPIQQRSCDNTRTPQCQCAIPMPRQTNANTHKAGLIGVI